MRDVLAPLSPNARLRYDIVARLLSSLSDASTFLEIGCGQGALATILARRYEYLAYEPDEESFLVARQRLAGLGEGRIVNAPLPDVPEQTYDIVGAFEVLEHMEDDQGMLAEWVEWIRPGGHLLLSVPAHPQRFGPGDEYAGHFRRYSREGLTSVLRNAGMTHVEVATYGFPLGYGLEWARNWLLGRRLRSGSGSMESRTSGSGRRLQPGTALAPLVWAGTLPFRYMQRPFAGGELGTGFVARAQRPA